MISVLPDVEVLLDSGDGTYAFDLTDRVRLASLDVSGHGRSDEFDEANAGTLTVSLDNDDGALTSGAGFDELPFGFGGFGGVGGIFYPGQGIRYNVTVGATTVSRFTGRLTSAELGWEAETGLPSSVTLTAVDPLASLSRRILRSMLEEEILLDGPTAYYTLGEAQGADAAGDTSGRSQPALSVAGAGAALAFGQGIGPTDGMPSVVFAGGQYLQGISANFIGTGDWTIEAVVAISASPVVAVAVMELVSGGDRFGINVLTDGTAQGVFGAGAAGSSVVITDGLLHHLALKSDGVTIEFLVDGLNVGSASSAPLVGPMTQLTIGAGTAFAVPMAGSVASVALTPSALSASRIASHAAMALGDESEATEERFERLAAYGSITTSTTSGMSGQTMSPQDTAGKSFLDVLNEVARAEGGVLFADGEGAIVLQGRGYRGRKTTADLTISADDIDVGTTAPLDDQQLVNQVTVSREGGVTQVIPSAADLSGVELYPQSLDLVVDNDDDALRAGQWLIAKHSAAMPRLPSASIDLMRCPQAEQVIAAEVGDRWAIEDMPSQIWGSFGDQTLEGWSESLTIAGGNTASWTLAANLLPWSLQTALVLDDPVYGVLDAFPLMN